MQQILWLLQLNLFEERDLHALLFAVPPNNKYDAMMPLWLS